MNDSLRNKKVIPNYTISYWDTFRSRGITTQSAFTFSKLTIETLEQGVKYVQN